MAPLNTPPPPLNHSNENCFIKVAIICVSALCLLFIFMLIPALIFNDWWNIIHQNQYILFLMAIQYWRSYIIMNDIFAAKSPIKFYGKVIYFQPTQETYSCDGYSTNELIPLKSKKNHVFLDNMHIISRNFCSSIR